MDAALEEARGYRERILELAEAGAEATEEKERLLRDAELALERARTVGDLVIGAFFGHPKDKDRERARAARLEQVRAWFDSDGELPEELRTAREQARGVVTPFHWSIEFPEVFYAARPDPLQGRELTGAAFMDAFLGNTPFAGKNTVADQHGDRYIPWLQVVHPGAHGNADYCAHFFRRAYDLLGANGTMGFIATNTISQGDTRATSLHHLITQPDNSIEIYDAVRSLMWPGLANVAVAVVHVAKGRAQTGMARLDGEPVPTINCRLRGKPERPDPVVLGANADRSFVGSYVLGMGFTLTPEKRNELVRKNPKNAERIYPYIGGEEVNTSPTQDFDRYVINFGAMSLEEAERWPDLIRIVRDEVKPERDKNNRENYRKFWWRFGELRPGLFATIAPLKDCLVSSIVSKHLMFSLQPAARVFSHKLCVFPFDGFAHFGVLQSRVHERWTLLLSSTMKNDLNYSPSDCFETFPFPVDTALTATSRVELAGKTVYEARAKYMGDTQQGLTQTYNKLKDPEHTEARIVKLRRLHEAMDRAVLDAYGWHDIPVPSYGTPVTADDRRALEQFEDEVIDRLFALNQERAEEERRLGGAKTGRRPAAARAENDNEPASAHTTAAPPKSAPRQTRPGLKKTSVPPPPAPKRKSGGGSRKR